MLIIIIIIIKLCRCGVWVRRRIPHRGDNKEEENSENLNERIESYDDIEEDDVEENQHVSHVMNRPPPEYQEDVVVENQSDKKETQKEYKKEELPKEFQDITSTEQRQKMKTYQDLVNVANQLGSE